jgi:hypothetical protein
MTPRAWWPFRQEVYPTPWSPPTRGPWSAIAQRRLLAPPPLGSGGLSGNYMPMCLPWVQRVWAGNRCRRRIIDPELAKERFSSPSMGFLAVALSDEPKSEWRLLGPSYRSNGFASMVDAFPRVSDGIRGVRNQSAEVVDGSLADIVRRLYTECRVRDCERRQVAVP